MQVQEQIHALFNRKTIEKLSSLITLSPEQESAAAEWLAKLDSGELDKEKKNYFKFAIIVLQNILGYDIKKDLEFEEGNVEFSFRDSNTNKSVCIEAKGTSTKDLFSEQNRDKPEHQTPIRQTWDYMGARGFDYGIATNYRYFVLIDKSKSYAQYHLFDFDSVRRNPLKLKEFVAIFSRQSILEKGFIVKLYEESLIEDREFTQEFYKLYHETRLMLVKEYQDICNVPKEQAVHYAQLVLNRLIFLFFAEDTGKVRRRLFAESLVQSLNPLLVSEYSRYVSDTINLLFVRLDKGSYQPIEIFGFNGGLFREQIPNNIFFSDLKPSSYFKDVLLHSSLKQHIDRDDISQKIAGKFGGNLNPIINNLLLMSSFDFQTELNVNILGHIFEQSLTDLDELLDTQRTSKRKKEGIFYTPEYITDHICRNTIIPYLSKKGATTPAELVAEYSRNIDELEQRFQKIKIIDPACGSGAFLLKAVDVLLEIHKEIQIFKEERGRYTVSKKGKKTRQEFVSLQKWHEEEEARKIIENNIFGVDINDESVEITKLSLFLKIASNNRKLIDLTQNIQHGNSLVDNLGVAGELSFNWGDRFNNIIQQGGFDIVIGNPPYFNVESLGLKSPYAEHLKKCYPEIWMDKSDILFYFIAKALDISKGKVGFIVSNAFFYSEKAVKLRNHILKSAPLVEIVNFEKYKVFREAEITTAIIIADKEKNEYSCSALNLKEPNYSEEELGQLLKNKNNYQSIELKEDSVFALASGETERINSLIDNAGHSLGSLFKVGSGMQTGLNKVFVTNEYPKDFPRVNVRKRVSGDNIRKYHLGAESEYCVYVEDAEKFEDLPPQIQRHLLANKVELENRADKKRRESKWWNYTAPMHKELYQLEKIWCSYRSKRNAFALDVSKGEYLGLTNTTVIFGTHSAISLRYILALLNSKVLSFRYKTIGKQTGGGVFEYFENGVSKLPIPVATATQQAPFIERTTALIALYQDFYEKKEKFLNRIKQNYLPVGIPRRIEAFEGLAFGEFLRELRKEGAIIPLNEQEDLERYFELRRDELSHLSEEIGKIEREIDMLAYSLYHLDETSISFIEESLQVP